MAASVYCLCGPENVPSSALIVARQPFGKGLKGVALYVNVSDREPVSSAGLPMMLLRSTTAASGPDSRTTSWAATSSAGIQPSSLSAHQ